MKHYFFDLNDLEYMKIAHPELKFESKETNHPWNSYLEVCFPFTKNKLLRDAL